MRLRILFVGGGSIGHVAPCVSVWRAAQASHPDAAAHFICTNQDEEAEFLRKEKVAFTPLADRRMSFLRMLKAIWQSRALMKQWKPDVVFGKGGLLSVPVTLAARSLGLPVVLHESDAVSGRANKLIARWAHTVCLGFPQHKRDGTPLTGGTMRLVSGYPLSNAQCVFTGNPVRPSIGNGARGRGMAITGFSGKRPVLIVLGGSQGAQAINDAVTKHLEALLEHADIIHLTGRGKGGIAGRPGYWAREFVQDQLADLYALSDFALSRAGAGTLSELARCGIPALLVPLRGLAQDHQLCNALAACRTGGCVMLHQTELDRTLVAAVTSLAQDRDRRATMGKKAFTLAMPDAAERIAAAIAEAAKKMTR